MARGWESKSVESQQQERESQSVSPGSEPPDPEAAAARRTMELAKSRAESDLGVAKNPAHRAMLEKAIAALTQLLEK